MHKPYFLSISFACSKALVILYCCTVSDDEDDDDDDAFVTDEYSISSDSHDSIDETQEGEVQRTQEAFETVVPETQVLISQQANDDVVIIPDEDADEIPPGVNDAIEVRDASALPT